MKLTRNPFVHALALAQSATSNLPAGTILKPVRAWHSSFRLGSLISLSALNLLVSHNAQAATKTWDAGGGDLLWNTGNNWNTNGTPVNGDTIVFANTFTSGTAISLNGDRTINDLSITGTTDFSLNNNTLTITTGDITRSGASGTTTINSAIVLGAAGAWSITGSLTANGIISGGTNTLTKSGAGTLTLANANSYTGLTTVSAGTLAYGAANALSSGGVTVSGGTLDILTFSDTVGTVTLSSGSINGSSGVLTGTSYALTNSGSVSAILAGAGSLTKTGAGTTTLSGANTYTGVTAVNAGVLSVGTIGNGSVASGNLGSASNLAANLVLGGGTLQYTGATGSTDRNFTLTTGTSSTIEVVNALTDLTIGGASTNTTGALAKTGAGKLILSGTNLFTGLTTVSAGTLEYGVTNALSSGAVTVAGGTLDIKTFSDTVGAVTLTSGSIDSTTGVLTATSYAMQAGSVSAILAGAGAFNKTTAGTVTLSGVNTYTGVTTISAGVLSVATIGDGSVASNLGAGAVGAANLVIGNGTLQYTGATASTNRAFTITADQTATFDITTNDLTVSGSSAVNNGAMTKTGAGTLILSGANGHTGLTTVTNGTLAYGVNNALSSGAVTVNGGTLDISTFADTVGTVTLTSGSITGTSGVLTGTSYAMQSGSVSAILGGAGAMVKSTAGILTLTGNNTFSGGLDLSAGTLILGHNSAAGTGTLDLGGGTIEGSGGAKTITNNLAITGNNTFSGTENLEFTDSFDQGGARVYTVNNTTTFSGNIIGGDNLTKSGTGTLVLSGTNTIDTVTVNTGGALRVSSDGALGSTGFDTNVNSGGALELIGGRVIGAEAMSLNGSGVSNGGALRNISGNNSWAGTITLADVTAIHRINSNSGTLTISGAIGETGTNNNKDLTFGGAGNVTVTGNITASNGDMRLFKDGAGTLVLSGTANAFDGLTTVTTGTLFANNTAGSATGTGSVSVTTTGAILGGSGTITPGGANGISVTGVLAPGGSVGTTGNLTLNLGSTTGTVLMNSGASFQYDLGVAGIDINTVGTSDLLTLAGAAASKFAFNGNSIDFLGTGGVGYYKLFDTSTNNANTWTGLGGLPGFATNGGLITSGLTVSNLASGLSGSLIMGGTALGGTTGDIYLQVVPEPSAALLAGIGSLLLLRRRRVA